MLKEKLNTLDDYKRLFEILGTLNHDEHFTLMRELLRTDLFVMMTLGLGRKDVWHPWLLERCKEVEIKPDGHLDLWARAHYKSTIITLGKTIQDILASHGDGALEKWRGVEPTVGIFSCTRPLAKQFLAQIKREFEINDVLRQHFPDVLWENPGKEAPVWSLDSGIIVKRKSNPKEATVEAWGLVDGQPTGKHFFMMIYDDVVTIDNVRSTQMIEKTTEAWELSLNLGTHGGIYRYIGTRYHYADTYKVMMDRGSVKPRLHPATIDGSMDGEPVFLSKEELAEKRKNQGPYTFSSQQLLNPIADDTQGFKKEWLEFYDPYLWDNMNIYILVDPANEKKKTSDYTVFTVVGLASDNNYYVLEWTRDRLSLTERGDELFRLHRKYRPKMVGYERYGMQADIAYIKDVSRRTNYNFKMVELKGQVAKNDRIRAMIPIFEEGRVYLPNSCNKTDYERKTRNLTDVFINEEYLAFPVGQHDDMMDSLARILDEDLKAVWPKYIEPVQRYSPRGRPIQRSTGSGWGA